MNVIAKNQYLPSNAKKFCKVMELPVNVTTNGHRAFNRLHKQENENKYSYTERPDFLLLKNASQY